MRPKKVILCVNHNEQELSVLKFMLSTNGYRVFAAASGQEAIGLFAGLQVDLVLADFGLEGDFRVDAHAESRIIDRSKVLILELNIKDVVAVSYCTLCAIAPPKS